MILTKEFNTRLMALKVSGKKLQYTQAFTVLGEMASGIPVSKTFHPEKRLPNCYKYELPDGYRIFFTIRQSAGGDWDDDARNTVDFERRDSVVA